jgi:DNA processing protein
MQDGDWPLWLRLLMTPGLGPASIRKLLRHFGSPEAVLGQSTGHLAALVGDARAQALGLEPAGWAAQVQLTRDWLAQAEPQTGERRVILLGDEAYPHCLLDIDEPPLLLYAQVGQPWAGLSDERLAQALCERSLAVVGSRNPTPQGVLNAKAFSADLAQQGWTIVSGLALGIDGAAHAAALEHHDAGSGRIPTIAVVGTGLDRVYPSRHLDLARQISRQGVILSEFHLGEKPLAANFPRRNRLIAGLSRGTLVVEAALESGSLITARLSAEQGRDVFAIPGSIHSAQSRGCHALIKQGAKLVESVQDILDELPWSRGAASAVAVGATQQADAQPEGALLQAMGLDPVSLDDIQDRTGMSAAQLQAELLEWELAGKVARLPGGLFQRLVRA